jgi:hypothetical protein
MISRAVRVQYNIFTIYNIPKHPLRYLYTYIYIEKYVTHVSQSACINISHQFISHFRRKAVRQAPRAGSSSARRVSREYTYTRNSYKPGVDEIKIGSDGGGASA